MLQECSRLGWGSSNREGRRRSQPGLEEQKLRVWQGLIQFSQSSVCLRLWHSQIEKLEFTPLPFPWEQNCLQSPNTAPLVFAGHTVCLGGGRETGGVSRHPWQSLLPNCWPGAAFSAPCTDESSHWLGGQLQSPASSFQYDPRHRYFQTSLLPQDFVHLQELSVEQERARTKALSRSSTLQQLHVLAILLTPTARPTFDPFIHNYLLGQTQTQMPGVILLLMVNNYAGIFSPTDNKKSDNELLFSIC